ncbi:protein of unknown function [Prosthecobacter debontii]|uniref:DUF4340 domain-containing protein n=1 Tax=Prosthecobacter debontii TaxID=48467 RepID=A0A1T4YNX6_9BACT|nr:DUF4340 domain-containing protein [Prosthecobacter debontii]SKB03462.1 protein of unknown function [Prosthecobacter debontii]
MSLRTTVILLVLVAALGAVILGVERYLPSTRELLEMKRGPVKFNRGEISQFEIDSSGGDGVTLASQEKVWFVRRPFNDLADPEKVDKLMNELTAIGWIERVHREEFDDNGWTKTALDQPRHKLRLMEGEQCVLELWVGAASPIEDSHYLAIKKTESSDETSYYVARTALPELLKPAPKDWRDSKLIRLPADQVVGLKIVQESGQIELARTGRKMEWSLVKPLSTRGSKEKINELLSTLLNLEIKDAVELANGASAVKEAGTDITSQTLKLSIVTEETRNQPVEITLTKPKADASETKATISHRRPVFTVFSKSLANFWASPNDLRDKMLARIDEDAVQSVQIESGAFPPVLLEKQSESWFLRRHNRLEAANGDRVARLFQALNTQPVRNFTSDSAANLAAYGLDKAFLAVSWSGEGITNSRLIFGANADHTEFYAKYESEPSVYQIDAALLPSIPQEGIKWKGLGALRFTQFALRRISLAAGTQPPVILNYDPTTAQWTGERAGRDVTSMIDRVKADRLAGALAKFNVQDWSADATNAIQALKNPALTVVVTLGDPGTNSGPTRDIVVRFSPTQEGMDTALYFGQVDAGPDVFYIARASLLELLAPVFKSE